MTGFPIVLLLLAGLRCISGGVNSLPANRSEEDPCRPVFTLGISSTRTSTCTSTRNIPFRNTLYLASCTIFILALADQNWQKYKNGAGRRFSPRVIFALASFEVDLAASSAPAKLHEDGDLSEVSSQCRTLG